MPLANETPAYSCSEPLAVSCRHGPHLLRPVLAQLARRGTGVLHLRALPRAVPRRAPRVRAPWWHPGDRDAQGGLCVQGVEAGGDDESRKEQSPQLHERKQLTCISMRRVEIREGSSPQNLTERDQNDPFRPRQS
jgi:hypothetical protein